jgi:hypothetical protein
MLTGLVKILWALAIVVAARMTFGPGGEVLAGLIIFIWAGILKAFGLPGWAWFLIANACFFISGLIGLLIDPYSARESDRRTQCMNTLRQLALANLNFVLRHESFPRVRLPGLEGAGPQSWRVTLLPELDEQNLFKTYRKDESWDGPHNVEMSRTVKHSFDCPSDHTNDGTYVNYRAIVGEHTAWPVDRARPMSEITDGLSRTVVLIECASRGTPWSKPEDLTYDEAFELLTDPSPDAVPHYHESTNGFFYKSNAGPSLHVAFADGKVRLLDLPISKELATALLTVDGGEWYDEKDFEPVTSLELDYATCVGFPAFILLACLPEFRLFRRQPAIPPLAPLID